MAASYLTLALFLSSFTLSTAQFLTVPSNLPGTWTSQGCYTEVDRTLNEDDYTDLGNMTIETCISFCTNGGFTYAGTEYSDQCYCDYTVATGATNVSTTECSMPCVGNSIEPCGGPNRMNLFWNGAPPPQVNPGIGLWSYVGCFTEGKTGRVLPNEVSTNGGVANMTIDLCLSACQTAGFNLAGAEYGQECWCGDTFSNGGTISADSGCTILCANNKTEYCGGDDRLNVYNFNNTLNGTSPTGTSPVDATPEPPTIVPSIGPYKYYGCQTEGTDARAFSSNSTATDLMTLEYCAAWCVGYGFFGTEYGRECYCGNSFSAGSVPAPASYCSFTCASNSSEYCGASDHLSVYALNGTRDTPPPPATPLVLPIAGSNWRYQRH